MNVPANQRGLAASIALAMCFTAYSGRLVYLQVSRHKFYEEKAARQNVHTEPIFARRGAISDVRGDTLAQNEPVKTVIADASLINDPGALASLLAAPLLMPAGDIRARLVRKIIVKEGGEPQINRHIVLKKCVSEAKAAEIAQLVATAAAAPKKEAIIQAMAAVRFEQDFVRVYPNGTTLCHVLGLVNDDGLGLDGIEAAMNNRLAGRNGLRYVERDRTGRELVLYRGQEELPRDGGSVRLTIDMNLQRIVESELDIACRRLKPKKASIVMINPKNGDIMALANRPNFNPNLLDARGEKRPKMSEDEAKAELIRRHNIAITDQVEPGSTFKIVATSAALSERIVSPDTEIPCENGYWQWCKLHDHHPYPSLTVRNVLVKSSNIGAAKLGIQLGEQKFYLYARKFGFGDTSTINLPGEIRGLLPSPDAWDKLAITRMPMGHSVSATPLQITNAMCAIANGGTLMVPQIVREVVGEGGKFEYGPKERWRVVSEKAAAQVGDALVQVTGPKGTAVLARVPGYKVAGKTGTAQKADEHGRMAHEKYVCSFVGYMPADDPAFVMLVLLDEAQVDHESNYGGKIAAPVFSRIAAKAARYLNLQPTEPIPAPGSAAAKEDSVIDVRDQ